MPPTGGSHSERRPLPGTRAQTGPDAGAGRRRCDRAPAPARQTHRARADRIARRSGLVHRVRRLRGPPHDGVRTRRARVSRRRRGHRTRPHRRPPGVPVLPGLHRSGRFAGGSLRRKDLQGDGPRRPHGIADDRNQRLGRRAHSRRRGQPRRLCRDLLAQRPSLGGDSADQLDRRSLRGRRGLFARDHRLHHHDRRHLTDVHHRTRDHQNRHRRRRDLRAARRRDDPCHSERSSRSRSRGRRRHERANPRAAVLYPLEQP